MSTLRRGFNGFEMNIKLKDALLSLGLFVCLFGICYLAVEYFRYLSGIQKLISILLWVAIFVFLGKYFKSL